MGKSTISMAIFNSYVKLPEGIMFLGDLPLFMSFSLYPKNQSFYLDLHPLQVKVPRLPRGTPVGLPKYPVAVADICL